MSVATATKRERATGETDAWKRETSGGNGMHLEKRKWWKRNVYGLRTREMSRNSLEREMRWNAEVLTEISREKSGQGIGKVGRTRIMMQKMWSETRRG